MEGACIIRTELNIGESSILEKSTHKWDDNILFSKGIGLNGI
jgi:hypothetical protein